MKSLNGQYRKKPRPTDVLSFAGADPGSFGELIFCPQVLEKQAIDNKHAYKWELAYMLVHGVLHLLGYDHEKSDKEARKMYRLQDELFEKLRKSAHVRRNRSRRR